jgi:hypothetical protein
VDALARLDAGLLPVLRPQLLHLSLGGAQLLLRLIGLLPRLLSLLTALGVLLNLLTQVCAVARLLLLQVPDALVELIPILSLKTIPVL